jgi:hypothetical protein
MFAHFISGTKILLARHFSTREISLTYLLSSKKQNIWNWPTVPHVMRKAYTVCLKHLKGTSWLDKQPYGRSFVGQQALQCGDFGSRPTLRIGSSIFWRWCNNLLHCLMKTYPYICFTHIMGVKRQGREVDNSPPTSVEVEKMWICTSTPPYAFMA